MQTKFRRSSRRSRIISRSARRSIATDLSGPHAQLLTQHFNSIISGNDMKWSSVENTKGSLYLRHRRQRGRRWLCATTCRCAATTWSGRPARRLLPMPLATAPIPPPTRPLVTANIQEHIQNEVQHFGNKVYAWDVVNEPLDPNQPDCLAHGPFYKVLGKSYIDIALAGRAAVCPRRHQAVHQRLQHRRSRTVWPAWSRFSDLRSRGIPIDGVGHEMHNAINYPSVDRMVNAINTVANEFPGIDQQITEMDMSVYNAGDNTLRTMATTSRSPSSPSRDGSTSSTSRAAAVEEASSAPSLSGASPTTIPGSTASRSAAPTSRSPSTRAAGQARVLGNRGSDPVPGYGLNFAIASKTGNPHARVWTLTAADGNVVLPMPPGSPASRSSKSRTSMLACRNPAQRVPGPIRRHRFKLYRKPSFHHWHCPDADPLAAAPS